MLSGNNINDFFTHIDNSIVTTFADGHQETRLLNP